MSKRKLWVVQDPNGNLYTKYISSFDNMMPLDDLADRHSEIYEKDITYSDLATKGYRVICFEEAEDHI